MKITQFRVEDVFGDIINKDNISQEQIFKLKNFFSRSDVIKKVYILNLTFLKLEGKLLLIFNQVLLRNIRIFDS